MRAAHTSWLIVLLGGCATMMLGGCATVDRIVGVGSFSPPKPSPTGAFDGSYYGEADTVRGGPHCPEDRIGMAEVGDKRLSFAYAPLIIFNPPVQADGLIHDTVGKAELTGQIRGRRLHMVVSTPDCETHYDLSITGNRS